MSNAFRLSLAPDKLRRQIDPWKFCKERNSDSSISTWATRNIQNSNRKSSMRSLAMVGS